MEATKEELEAKKAQEELKEEDVPTNEGEEPEKKKKKKKKKNKNKEGEEGADEVEANVADMANKIDEEEKK